MIARGGALLGFVECAIPCPFPSVDDAAWSRFIRVLATSDQCAVSPSNALGAYEMRPRRMGDLGLMYDLRTVRSPTGRQVWWGTFKAPLTLDAFLGSQPVQDRALAVSLIDYERRIRAEEIRKPDGMTLSGALAVLHRADVGGLRRRRFLDTEALYQRAQGIF